MLITSTCPLVDDLPRPRAARLGRRERVAKPGRVGPVAAEGAELLAPVLVVEPKAVPSGLADCARRVEIARGGSPSSIRSTSQSRPSSLSTSPG